MEVKFTVPLIPPSCNSYVRHTRSGRHYVTAEARSFKDAVAIIRPRVNVPAKLAIELEAVLFLAKGQRGDTDNFAKVLIDSLVYSGLIVSDAKVTDLILRKRRDANDPRTEITLRTL